VHVIYENAATPFTDSALEIAKVTPEDALVVVQGESWDPTALYYSRRKGLMLDDHLPPSVARALPRQGYNYLFSLDPQTYPIEIVREWQQPLIELLRQFERARRLRDAFFRQGSQKLEVGFVVTPTALDQSASRLLIEIENPLQTPETPRNRPELWFDPRRDN
jgi:hypothetical protein